MRWHIPHIHTTSGAIAGIHHILYKKQRTNDPFVVQTTAYTLPSPCHHPQHVVYFSIFQQQLISNSDKFALLILCRGGNGKPKGILAQSEPVHRHRLCALVLCVNSWTAFYNFWSIWVCVCVCVGRTWSWRVSVFLTKICFVLGGAGSRYRNSRYAETNSTCTVWVWARGAALYPLINKFSIYLILKFPGKCTPKTWSNSHIRFGGGRGSVLCVLAQLLRRTPCSCRLCALFDVTEN